MSNAIENETTYFDNITNDHSHVNISSSSGRDSTGTYTSYLIIKTDATTFVTPERAIAIARDLLERAQHAVHANAERAERINS